MGGPGSGSCYHWWRDNKKTVVENCLSLDANRWMREGKLKEGVYQVGSWAWTYPSGGRFVVNYEVNTTDLSSPCVRLWYTWVWTSIQQQDSEDYSVRLTTTRPRFGGLRWWFICPLVINGRACNRRVGKLYLPPQGRYFGCRHCHDLTYTSSQESRKYDLVARYLASETRRDILNAKRIMRRIGKRQRKE
jgi:hypothetical protein